MVDSSLEENIAVDHTLIPTLVFLISSDSCQSTTFLFEVAKLPISRIGPDKRCLICSTEDLRPIRRPPLRMLSVWQKKWVTKAHSERLAVHPWMVRLEVEHEHHAQGVPKTFYSAEDELKFYFYKLNVNRFFQRILPVQKL